MKENVPTKTSRWRPVGSQVLSLSSMNSPRKGFGPRHGQRTFVYNKGRIHGSYREIQTQVQRRKQTLRKRKVEQTTLIWNFNGRDQEGNGE